MPWTSSKFVPAYRNQQMELSTKEKRLLWLNTSVSLLHSCISSLLSLGVILCEPDFLTSSWVTWYKPSAVFTLSVSTGYFIYDFIDLVATSIYAKAPAILVHHVLVGICYIAALFYRVGLPFLVLMLLLEINSVFLHVRKLMSMIGFTVKSHTYRNAWNALWATFLLTRFFLPVFVHIHLYRHRTEFPHEVYLYMYVFIFHHS
jgi:hypothetical protein